MNIEVVIMKLTNYQHHNLFLETKVPNKTSLGVADDYVVQLICSIHVTKLNVFDKGDLDYDGLLDLTRRWKSIKPT